MVKDYTKRTVRLVFGLFLCAIGIYCSIQGNVGLAPWDAFSMGLSYLFGTSYGNMSVISGLVIIAIDFLLKEKIGFGTFLNTILIGKFVDLISSFNLFPKLENFFGGVALLLLGQVIMCLGCYFYISAAIGCGPRDSLMVALGKKFDKIPIGFVRICLEGTVLFLGWLLGAKVGVGTLITVFAGGIIMEFVYKLLKFDVKGVQHENIVDTIKIWAAKKESEVAPEQPTADID